MRFTEIIEFIKDNIFACCAIVLGIIEVILLIFRKIKIEDSPLAVVLEKLPTLVALSESKVGPGNGPMKKTLALSSAIAYYKAIGGKNQIEEIIDSAIESILSAPQKKGSD